MLLELYNKVSGIKKQISNTFVRPLRCYLMAKLGVFSSYSNDFNVIALYGCQKLLEIVRRCYKLLELYNKVSGIKKQISNIFVRPLRRYLTAKLCVFCSYSNDFNLINLNGCQKLLEDVRRCQNYIIRYQGSRNRFLTPSLGR